jgi:2-acylglycerol O-acyltransferase 2
LRGGIASIMFQLPVMKHNYGWAGSMPAGSYQWGKQHSSWPQSHSVHDLLEDLIDTNLQTLSLGLYASGICADKKLMLAHLSQPGASLSIIPEGIAGIFVHHDAETETIFLSKRKGFVKLAIQAGAGQWRSLPVLLWGFCKRVFKCDPCRMGVISLPVEENVLKEFHLFHLLVFANSCAVQHSVVLLDLMVTLPTPVQAFFEILLSIRAPLAGCLVCGRLLADLVPIHHMGQGWRQTMPIGCEPHGGLLVPRSFLDLLPVYHRAHEQILPMKIQG